MTIISKPASKEYLDQFDLIFRKKQKPATPNHLLHDSEDDKFPDEPKPTNTQK